MTPQRYGRKFCASCTIRSAFHSICAYSCCPYRTAHHHKLRSLNEHLAIRSPKWESGNTYLNGFELAGFCLLHHPAELMGA